MVLAGSRNAAPAALAFLLILPVSVREEGQLPLAEVASGPEAPQPPTGLSEDDWGQIRGAMRASGYHATPVAQDGGAQKLVAPNVAQGYRTTFQREGVEIAASGRAAGSWRLAVSVKGYGYRGDVRPLPVADPRAEKERVEYRRGAVTEWYVNRPGGLEQGFTIAEPETRRSEPIALALAVEGDLRVAVDDTGVAQFRDTSGRARVRYAGLAAWDADGRSLPAWLDASEGELQVLVETGEARFPVTVDPTFVHEAQLLGRGDPMGQAGAWFGYSVSVSGDTAVVGAWLDDTPGGVNEGSAYVFVRSGTTWTEQQRLVASDGAASDEFGGAVSISGDTVVVGARGSPGGATVGSAYVFVRSGATWTQQQKLLASDGAAADAFGTSVSVSGDTLVVGAFLDDTAGGSDAGSAYVFVRTVTTWTQQQKLLASDGAASDLFGASVSISGDTVVVGAYLDEAPGGINEGSAYVFVRTVTTWTQQQKLLPSDAAPTDWFGYSVSIAGDTVVVGAPTDDTPGGTDAGSAYVFVRTVTTWTEEQRLVASDGATMDSFGWSVSVSGDTVVAGAYLGAGFAGSAYVFVRSGTTWTEQQKLLASDGAGGDAFGFSVAVSGDTLVAGAYLDQTAVGVFAGSAYVFVRSGTVWTEQQKLLESDAVTGDVFGGAVSVSGDTVVVGADLDDTAGGVNAGSAYVFVRSGTTWTEQQKLLPSDAAATDWFGSSVSIAGDTVVVGAPFDDTPGGTDAGSAYVFVRSGTTWTQQQKLLPSDAAATDWFGSSVSIAGDTVVVGSPADDTPGGLAAGSAYVFVRAVTTWTEQQKLFASDGAASDYFGYSVSVSGDTVVVGAQLDDTPGGADAGSAYVFVRSGTSWIQQQQLLAADGAVSDQFGYSVSVSGDTVVVGAVGDDTPGSADAGSAYVFVRSGASWTQQQKLLAADGAASDQFGYSVSVSGDTVVVGALYDDTPGGADAGSAYVFVRSGTTWTQQPKLLASDGAASDLFGGSVSASGDTVVVGASGDDTPGGVDAGSAHVFRAQADLGVTKTDGQTTAVPGQPVTYTISVANAGPSDATGATVTDTVPAALQGVTWTCTASPGSTCSPGGPGNINDTVNLLAGGTATYVLSGTLDPAATGTLDNTATVAAPGGVTDPNPANNAATDSDTLTPTADLAIAKTDGQTTAVPGQPVVYTITVSNSGPSIAADAPVSDVLPASLTGATWTCVASPGSSCTASGAGSINDSVDLPVNGTAIYVLAATLDPGASGTLVNTATVSAPGGSFDPVSANNSATDVDAILPAGVAAEGELTHGYAVRHDLGALPGPAADEDVFVIFQGPRRSFEVLLDGASGDIGVGSGPLLERLASDASTVLQVSAPAGAGGSRSLRWANSLDTPVADEFVRVRSAGCGTDCDASDVYRLSVRETTASIPRFNNSATQITLLVLQNTAAGPVTGNAHFWDGSGALLGTQAFALVGKASLALNTSTVPGVSGQGGSITVAHDGAYGTLTGKAVAIEPATGFTFDTPLESRRP